VAQGEAQGEARCEELTGSARVVAGDSLDVALEMKRRGRNPLVLNMADDVFPGGVVHLGSGAQEESLFRRTNLCCTLDIRLYPLGPLEGVYTPLASVFKAAEADGWAPHDPVPMAFASVPALRNPRLVDGALDERDAQALERKVELLCHVAHTNGHDALVLGAMGCGAWRCPPAEVARIMHDVVRRCGAGLDIVIAILPGAERGYMTRATFAGRETGNLPAFEAEFGRAVAL
jgi:uncharacterized protein (TIGR02452 family)